MINAHFACRQSFYVLEKDNVSNSSFSFTENQESIAAINQSQIILFDARKKEKNNLSGVKHTYTRLRSYLPGNLNSIEIIKDIFLNLYLYKNSSPLAFHLPLTQKYREQKKLSNLNIVAINEKQTNLLTKFLEYRDFQQDYTFLCTKTIESYKDGSLAYSRNLQEAETKLNDIEKMLLENSTVEQQKELTEMRKQFNDLYKMIPIGNSVLFKKDLEKIKKLYTLPSNETYTISSEKFYEPKVTVKQLSDFFQEFCEVWNYSGIDVSMKTNCYYDIKLLEMAATTITFRKKKSGSALNFFNGLYSCLTNFATLEEENLKKQIKTIRRLLNKNILNSWRFSSILSIGDTTQCSDTKNISEIFGCYVILSHKRVIVS